MKKTQMIHSPRTFKLGLGLILAAGLVSMPVLTGASERDDTKETAKTASNSNDQLKSIGKSTSKKKASAETKKKLASTKKPAAKGRRSSAEDRSKDRSAKLESEAKKIAAMLTPTQRTKLLTLLNKAETRELTSIEGVGTSRSAAIKEARPIESVEDLQWVKGVGLKTLADVVDHGRTLTRSRSGSSKSKSGNSRKEKS